MKSSKSNATTNQIDAMGDGVPKYHNYKVYDDDTYENSKCFQRGSKRKKSVSETIMSKNLIGALRKSSNETDNKPLGSSRSTSTPIQIDTMGDVVSKEYKYMGYDDDNAENSKFFVRGTGRFDSDIELNSTKNTISALKKSSNETCNISLETLGSSATTSQVNAVGDVVPENHEQMACDDDNYEKSEFSEKGSVVRNSVILRESSYIRLNEASYETCNSSLEMPRSNATDHQMDTRGEVVSNERDYVENSKVNYEKSICSEKGSDSRNYIEMRESSHFRMQETSFETYNSSLETPRSSATDHQMDTGDDVVSKELDYVEIEKANYKKYKFSVKGSKANINKIGTETQRNRDVED